MEQNYCNTPEQQGSVMRGLIGALLGAILGAIIAGIFYIVLEQSNTLLGFLMGFLIITGYNLFKGRTGASRLVICIVCIVLGVVLAEAIFYVGLIEQDYAEYIEKLEAANIPKSSSLYQPRSACYQFYLEDPEVRDAFLKDVGTSFLFVGGTALISVLVSHFGKKNEEQTTPVTDPGSNDNPDLPSSDNTSIG